MFRRTAHIGKLQQWLYPELLLIQDLRERHQIFCLVDPLHGWTLVLVFPFVVLGAILGLILGMRLEVRYGMGKAVPICVLLGGIVAANLVALYVRNNTRRNLRMELAKRGYPICIECGYDLRGQTEPRCPECGTRFKVDELGQAHFPTRQNEPKPKKRRLEKPHPLPWERWMCPELSMFRSQDELESAMGNIYAGRSWPIIEWIVAFAIAFYSAEYFGRFLARFLPAGGAAGLVPACIKIVLSTSLFLIYVLLRLKAMRRRLRFELVARGHLVCLECGYDLRGLVDQRCPECGIAFDLTKPPYAGQDQS